MKLLAAIAWAAAMSTASFGAMAETCVALDYEEMKDMSTPELTKTYCSYHAEWQDNLESYLMRKGKDSEELAHACEGQVKRVGRTLKKREDGKQAIMDRCPKAY